MKAGVSWILRILVVGAIGVGVFQFATRSSLKGDYVDAVYLPQDGGKLWLYMDDSLYFTLQKETASEFSRSTKSLFNKTYSYLYDPITEKVIRYTKTKYPRWSSPPHPNIYYINTTIWQITPTTLNYDTGTDHDADIQTIDPKTGAILMDHEGFLEKYPELKSGIAKLYVMDDPDEPLRLDITTKDGQDFKFYVRQEVLVKNEIKDNAVPIFALSSDDRAELSIGGKPLSDRVYLKGFLLYRDGDVAVIVHQTEIGKEAERLVTAVDAKGTGLWTLPQKELFDDLAIESDDGFTDIFFVEDDLHAQKEGDVFVLKMDDVGIMGIDMKTGKKLWMFEK